MILEKTTIVCVFDVLVACSHSNDYEPVFALVTIHERLLIIWTLKFIFERKGGNFILPWLVKKILFTLSSKSVFQSLKALKIDFVLPKKFHFRCF